MCRLVANNVWRNMHPFGLLYLVSLVSSFAGAPCDISFLSICKSHRSNKVTCIHPLAAGEG